MDLVAAFFQKLLELGAVRLGGLQALLEVLQIELGLLDVALEKALELEEVAKAEVLR